VAEGTVGNPRLTVHLSHIGMKIAGQKSGEGQKLPIFWARLREIK
jgi:hypothetical protein